MKAVITKSQLDRIKNFINETREIPKANVLKEYETKQGSKDFPFEIGFEFIRQNGGKDFLMSKGISNWAMFKKALLNKSIKSSDINQFKSVDGQSLFDTEFGSQLPMNEKKSFPDLTGDGKVTRADILKGRGIELDEEKYPWDKCFKDALQRYGSKKIASKVCGSIKAKSKMDEDDDCGCGGSEEHDTRYMFFSNLEQMMRQARMLLQMDEDMIEDLLNNGHDWAADHIAEAKNNMDQVFDFIMNEMNGEGEDADWDSEEEKEMVYEAMSFKKKDQILEGTYQGRKVTLNKPFLTPDGPKKRSVYVKNAKGNVVKVNFGDPNMRIKKNIPSHRKSFRARHKCETANDKTSARYWSCKAW